MEKERQLGKACLSKQLITDNWSQAMEEVRRQYRAIDSALEVQLCSGDQDLCSFHGLRLPYNGY